MKQSLSQAPSAHYPQTDIRGVAETGDRLRHAVGLALGAAVRARHPDAFRRLAEIAVDIDLELAGRQR